MKKRIVSGLIVFCLIVTGINSVVLLFLPAFRADDDSYKVWATITNNMSTKGSTAFTTKTFNNSGLLNKSVSIDTLIPRPWTIEYDRASLAKYVDYLAVMTYDEHYAGRSARAKIKSGMYFMVCLRRIN